HLRTGRGVCRRSYRSWARPVVEEPRLQAHQGDGRAAWPLQRLSGGREMTAMLGSLDKPIPVYLLTGFLGSGKTRLLNRMLRPDGPRTAVIVNEFGDVPIDNDLFKVDGTASDLIETSTGCICCEPGNDIVSTLSRLSES